MQREWSGGEAGRSFESTDLLPRTTTSKVQGVSCGLEEREVVRRGFLGGFSSAVEIRFSLLNGAERGNLLLKNLRTSGNVNLGSS